MRMILISLILVLGFASVQPALADGPDMLMVSKVTFSPDGTMLAAAGDGKGARFNSSGRVEMWNLATRKFICSVTASSKITSAAFRSDGKVIVTGSEDKSVSLWSVPGGRKLISLGGATAQVWDVAFSPDGKKVAAANGWDSGQVLVWNAGNGTRLLTLTDKTEVFYSVAFSPDGKFLATGDRKGRVTLWDSSSGSKIREWKDLPGWATVLRFNLKGNILAAGGNTEIHLYDPAGGTLLKAVNNEWGCTSLDFFPGSERLLAGRWNSGVAPSNGDVAVWDFNSGTKLSTMGKSEGRVCAALSPDGKTVAAGYETGSVKILEASSGKVQYTLGSR